MTRKCIARLCLLLALLLLCGCAKREEPDAALDIDASRTPAQSAAPGNPESPENPGSSAQPFAPGTGKLKIESSVCYAFPGMLYGAVAYTNTDDTAIALTQAAFTFTYAGGEQRSEFVPVTAGYEAVQPNETAWCTLWLHYDDAAGAPQGLALTAQLSAAEAAAPQQTLAVSNARLIQNYPRFATLSGRLTNPGANACDLNLVYAAFYDADGAFLGAWHFTRNAVLQPGDSTAFEVHLQSLPIEGLSEKTAEIRFRAFGI